MTNDTAVATHTPGPWRMSIEYRAPSVTSVDIVSDYAAVILGCVHMGGGIPADDAAANARLIAAAPDLLAALKGFVGQPHDLNCVEGQFAAALIAARDAIAKAEGR